MPGHNGYHGKKLLTVLAHPDDETFGMGGTLALYAQRGVQVDLICTTRGESGDVQPKYLENYDSIADLRVAELNCAARMLGIHEVMLLDYRDSGMAGSEANRHPQALVNTPIDRVVSDIVCRIRRLQPDIVLTHDPAGNYFHPDHITTHQATVLAFFFAGDKSYSCPGDLPPYQPEKLYFYTFQRRGMKWLLRAMPLMGMNPRKYGRNGDINLEQIVSMNFPIHVEVDYKEVETIRENASRCHASQGGGSREMTLYGRLRRWLAASRDAFMQAYPTPADNQKQYDLFD